MTIHIFIRLQKKAGEINISTDFMVDCETVSLIALNEYERIFAFACKAYHSQITL